MEEDLHHTVRSPLARALPFLGIVCLGALVGVCIASGQRDVVLLLLLLLAPAFVIPLNLPAERIFILVAGLSILLVLTTPPWLDLSYVTGRIQDNRITVPRIVLFFQAAVLVAALARAMVGRGRNRTLHAIGVSDLLVLGWVVFASASAMRSLDPSSLKNFLQTVLLAAFFYLFARVLTVSERDLRGLVKFLLTCAAILVGSIVLEATTHVAFLPPGVTNRFGFNVYQASGLLAWPTTSAFVLILIIPLSTLFWSAGGSTGLLSRLFTSVLAVGLFLTFSRSALIGAAAGPCLVIAMSGKLRKLFAVLLVAGVVLAVAYPWIASANWFQDRILNEETAMDRVTFLQEAARIFGSNNPSWLLFGIGYDNFRHFRMLDPAMWEHASAGYIRPESYPTHNTHLTILLEMGLIAFVFWVAIHFFFIRTLFRAWRNGDGLRSRIGEALLLSEISFLIAANGHTMIPDYPVFALFWFMLGLASHPAGVLSLQRGPGPGPLLTDDNASRA